MQTALVILTFILAVGFLVKKIFLKPATPKNKKGNCGGSDCGCH